jgi:hypothetical protein
MNPARFSQMMKYLTRAKKEKPDLPDVFPASKAPIPAKTQTVEEMEAINAFIRRERQQKAGGGRIELKVGTPSKKELEIAEKVYGIKPEFEGKIGLDLWKEIGAKKRSKIREGTVTGEPVGMGKLKKNQLGKDDFIKLANQNKGKTFKEFSKILKSYKTRDGKDFTTQNISERLSNYNLKNFFKRDPAKGVSNEVKAAADKKRKASLLESDPTKAKGTEKFNYHHITQIEGGIPLTSDDVSIINQRLNSQLGGETNKALNRISAAIRKNNRLALEAMNDKQEGLALDYMKRSDELNVQAEKIVNSAIDKLPKKYKGYVGFKQFTLPRDEYGLPIKNEPMIIKKIGNTQVSKNAIDLTTLTKEGDREFRKIVKAQAERGEVGPIKLTSTDKKILNNIQGYSKLPQCKVSAADGGRIGFAFSDECIRDGLKEQKLAAQQGNKKAARELVQVGKVATRAGLLKNLLGPGAILGEAVYEGALIGNKVLGGKPADIAWAESYLSYLDPRKYRGELDPLKMEREDMLESTADKNILRSGFAAQDQISDFNEAIEERDRAKKAGRLDEYNPAAADAREQGRLVDQSADIISSEAFKDATNVAKEYLQGQSGQQQADFGVFSVPQSAQADEGRRVRAMTEMRELNPLMSNKELLELLKSYSINPKDYDYTYTPRNFPADTSSKPLTGFDNLRDFYQQQQATQNIADAGGVANLAEGGVASGPPPVRGPNPQGLLSLKNRVRNY